MALEKTYLYKVSRNSNFLGVLQNVVSPFVYSQTINTAGAQLDVTIGVEPFNADQAPDYLVTEAGERITTEAGDYITIERQPDIYGNINPNALIRNNNDVEVYEISANNPNGKLVFAGYISKWSTKFGAANSITATVVSYGAELDNYIIEGQTTVDQSQLTQDTTFGQANGNYGPKFASWNLVGQTFTPAQSSISSILVKLTNAVPGFGQTVYIFVYSGFTGAYNVGTLIGSASRVVNSDSATDYLFTFDTPLVVAPGTPLFFYVDGLQVGVSYKTANPYASGAAYTNTYGGAGPASAWAAQTYDLYFATYYTAGATDSPFTSTDPATIISTIIDSYAGRGGRVNYGSGTLVATGVPVTYTFKIATVLEGIKKALDLSPADWYWYVDPGTNILYFKETSTTADHRMVLGRHILELDLEATVENLKNVVYFSGGEVSAGVNLFLKSQSTTSLANYRQGVARISDNRVTSTTTGNAELASFLNANSSETYNTTLIVLESTYDISLFKLGQVVGFGGFGNFIDSLLLQIVAVRRESDKITMTLGVLPKRATATIEQILRDINDLQTIANPSSPS